MLLTVPCEHAVLRPNLTTLRRLYVESSGCGSVEVAVRLAGDVSLEAAADLEFGLLSERWRMV
jgi:hypothetical protein